MLTGESIPVLKKQIIFNSSTDQEKAIKEPPKQPKKTKLKSNLKKVNILYGGTKVICKKSEIVEAIVIGTGWNTRKGKLLGSVVFS